MFLRLYFPTATCQSLIWVKNGGDKVQALWDEGGALNKFTIGKGCGCKAQKCAGLTTCCRSCYRMCTTCTVKCKCKTLCNNPHNNGETCHKCTVPDESEASDEEYQDGCNDVQNDDNGEV